MHFPLEIWSVEFKQLSPTPMTQEAHTPAALEKLLLENHVQSVGDFMFIEWPKLQEELLLTTERSALMRSDTRESIAMIRKHLLAFYVRSF